LNFLLFSSLFFLFYIYGGYLLLLRFVYSLTYVMKKKIIFKNNIPIDRQDFPSVTVFFSAYNEEEKVESRLLNLTQNGYPVDLLEIIVVSDGSKDRTAQLAKAFADKNPEWRIRVIEIETNRGRAYAQNMVAKESQSEILVTTDAETKFKSGMLHELVKPFANPKVGVVGAVVLYLNENDSPIGNSYNTYRSLERKLRNLESKLGILPKTDGPCTAYRKYIWEPIEDFEDVDQVISLVARKKGYLTIHADTAECLDRSNTNIQQELLQRSRMTRKALFSTFARWRWHDVLNHPYFSFALFSHKIIRFFSPLFFLTFIISIFFLSIKLDFRILISVIAFTFFLILVFKWKLSNLFDFIFKRALSLLIAQVGFAMGIYQWITGNKTGQYTPTRKAL